MQGEALLGMTTPDVQKRTADELKELLRFAWSNAADPLLTASERSEVRNQIRRYGAELRRFLQPTGVERSSGRHSAGASHEGASEPSDY